MCQYQIDSNKDKKCCSRRSRVDVDKFRLSHLDTCLASVRCLIDSVVVAFVLPDVVTVVYDDIFVLIVCKFPIIVVVYACCAAVTFDVACACCGRALRLKYCCMRSCFSMC